MSKEGRKKKPKICEELIEACHYNFRDFQENDVPVLLEYGIIPPEKKRAGLYDNDDFVDKRISSFFVKSHEISFLNGDRRKIKDRLERKLRRGHSEDIFKGYKVRSFQVFTCEEALGKGYEKEIQKEIDNQLRELPWGK